MRAALTAGVFTLVAVGCSASGPVDPALDDDFITAYLPFADQWDQALELWAPDSDAFAYASVVPGGESSILVQDLDGGLPESLGPGYFVTWSEG